MLSLQLNLHTHIQCIFMQTVSATTRLLPLYVSPSPSSTCLSPFCLMTRDQTLAVHGERPQCSSHMLLHGESTGTPQEIAPLSSYAYMDEVFDESARNYSCRELSPASYRKVLLTKTMAAWFVAWLVLACCMAPASAFQGAISFQGASSFQGTYGPSCVHVQ